ncbi:MAG TPA: ester cyclase [Bryobacteraceae bacterium]|jgi:predicted ester cyclase
MTTSTISYSSSQTETEQERANIDLVMEYMNIAYDPTRASGKAVAHLCATGNRFIGPTTFPNSKTLEDYADDHAKIMKQVNNLHFVTFDVVFVKEDRVCLRYTAEGTHSGEPHGEIKATGRKAQWTASALFKIENGKLVEFIKEWNKLPMWEQFGWPIEECLTQH